MAVGDAGILGACLHGPEGYLLESVRFSCFDEIFLSSAEGCGRAAAFDEGAGRPVMAPGRPVNLPFFYSVEGTQCLAQIAQSLMP